MFGEHAAFIIPSYLVSVAALSAIAIYIILTHQSRRAELKRLEVEAGQPKQADDVRP